MTGPLDRVVAVTALGATTSVGWDVVSAAASVRAGLNRAGEVPGAEVLDEETHEPTPVIGHAVRGLTDGFVLFGRWLRLARTAVEDLLRSQTDAAVHRPGYWERSILLLATRTPDETIFLDEWENTIAAIREMLGLALIDDLGLSSPPAQIEVLPSGHLAGAAALRRAASRIGVDCDRALIIGVDTLLDPLILEELDSQHRLKHAGNPAGLAPGEAAAALLLEAADNPERRTAAAFVRGVSIHERAPSDDDEEPALVGSLRESFFAALDQAGLPELSGDLYLDLNGEPWRAHQWGSALIDIQTRFTGQVRLPAVSVGEVGAATGVLGVCLACRAFSRGYAGDEAAVVLSAGEAGDSACIVLGAPDVGVQA